MFCAGASAGDNVVDAHEEHRDEKDDKDVEPVQDGAADGDKDQNGVMKLLMVTAVLTIQAFFIVMTLIVTLLMVGLTRTYLLVVLLCLLKALSGFVLYQLPCACMKVRAVKNRMEMDGTAQQDMHAVLKKQHFSLVVVSCSVFAGRPSKTVLVITRVMKESRAGG